MRTFYQLVSKDGLKGPITESSEPVYKIKTVLRERLSADGMLLNDPNTMPSRDYEYERKESVLLITMREK